MDALRCQYASKPCEHPRSFKENGDPHRLCAYHRERANDAQRRWHSRQRAVVEMISDSGAEVSERTKRRRRAAQAARVAALLGEAHVPRMHRVHARPTKAHSPSANTAITNAQAPSSPPSVDSASFSAMLRAPFLPESLAMANQAVGGDDHRLSVEDRALLDELLLCMDATKSIVSVDSTHATGFFDSAWPPVSSAFAMSTAPYFV